MSVCGNIAGDTKYTSKLLAAGIRSLSVTATSIAPVKAAVRRAPLNTKLNQLKGGFMKRLLNETDQILNESLLGFSAAHNEILSYNPEPRFIFRKGGATKGKVSLISGGGSGHEPLHAGLVGKGMLDAACPRRNFYFAHTRSNAECCKKSLMVVRGILYIVKNYSGDVMNFEIASEMLEQPNKTIFDQ